MVGCGDILCYFRLRNSFCNVPKEIWNTKFLYFFEEKNYPYWTTLPDIHYTGYFFEFYPNLFGHIAYLNVFTGGKWLIDVYWSLAIEFQYYLFIAICFALIVSDKIYWRLLFIILFLLSSLIPFPPNSFVFAYSPYFIAGILLFQLVCSITGLAEFFIYMALMTGFLAYEQGIVLICIVLITMLVILFINRVPAFLRYMGLISYSLYLTHVPIGGRIINITEVKTSNILAREMMVFAAFLVCIFAASVFYWLFEKRFKIFSGSIKYDHDSSNYKTVQPYNSQVWVRLAGFKIYSSKGRWIVGMGI